MEIKDPHINRRIGNRRFIKSWAWPGEVEDFIREHSQGFTVHICCGSSSIGNLTIDQYMPADIKASMYQLPLKTSIADTVICDPPWGIPRQKRHKLLFELRRILKLGGTLLFNCPWLPRVPGLELKEIWLSESIYPNNDCGVISISTKTKESLFNDR